MDIEKSLHQREYGYLNENTIQTVITQKKGQYISGYSVGILYLDEAWYPVLPGNVANLSTYNFPVRLKKVPNCTIPRLLNGDESLLESIIAVAQELEAEGARAISSACGFFGNFQDKVADAVNIPVYLSSVVQIPWIKIGLKSSQKIGVLTAYEAGMKESLFKSCGVYDSSSYVIADLSNSPEFSAIIESRGSFDNEKVREEVVTSAINLVNDNPDIATILLECSDLPPYAEDIQRYVQLPVYDFITLINWIHHSTSQKPYQGFI
ncbi:aspartate/glutamate racemase family protein [Salicibibacter cibarius]|uniref:Aspartate/glutamate racemase family protein n=1 Tax=Salicibibacter cibarius TaxID=2743000 RepID=A0A7T7CD90_9BACI|nr:aspartate/glutamate racemase family protein [Salicibibacter cibarius]QQK77747.1 aspartate/glutamate racemase family protein [Salicibibacter cibarius]